MLILSLIENKQNRAKQMPHKIQPQILAFVLVKKCLFFPKKNADVLPYALFFQVHCFNYVLPSSKNISVK